MSGAGGSAGFPSGGKPYGTINIGTGLQSYSVDVNEHVITHELGHAIGFRHSDYYNRSISCGGGGHNEGTAGVGAILIPGTPSTATVGGVDHELLLPLHRDRRVDQLGHHRAELPVLSDGSGRPPGPFMTPWGPILAGTLLLGLTACGDGGARVPPRSARA